MYCQILFLLCKETKQSKLEAQWVEPVLLTFHSILRKLYTEPSIGASYQVSVLLAKGFRRRRLKCEKLTDDGRQVMAKAHIDFGKVS